MKDICLTSCRASGIAQKAILLWQYDFSWISEHAHVALQVVPSGYGQRLPWYFPVLPSYWKFNTTGKAEKLGSETLSGDRVLSEETSGKAAVAIRHLCKDFKTTDGYTKRAVDDLSLDVAGSKVTALLGVSSLTVAHLRT